MFGPARGNSLVSTYRRCYRKAQFIELLLSAHNPIENFLPMNITVVYQDSASAANANHQIRQAGKDAWQVASGTKWPSKNTRWRSQTNRGGKRNLVHFNPLQLAQGSKDRMIKPTPECFQWYAQKPVARLWIAVHYGAHYPPECTIPFREKSK